MALTETNVAKLKNDVVSTINNISYDGGSQASTGSESTNNEVIYETSKKAEFSRDQQMQMQQM